MTQQELADDSGISIRTIQRIEKGLASGSPHTIRSLASSLNIEAKELMILEMEDKASKVVDLAKVRLLNFSILAVLILPFGNLIVPSILLLLNKTNQEVHTIGRKIIGTQIIVTFVFFVITVFIFLVIGRGNGAIPLPVFISYVLFGIVSIVLVARTSIDLDNLDEGEEVLSFFPKII